MHTQKHLIMPLIVGTIALTGCASERANEVGGQLTGGAAGALLGAQIGAGTGQLVAVGVGALIGALAGGEIANNLSREKPVKSATPPPTSNVRVDYRPIYEAPPPSTIMREYSHTVYIDGKPRKLHGKAFMKADGSWHLENN